MRSIIELVFKNPVADVFRQWSVVSCIRPQTVVSGKFSSPVSGLSYTPVVRWPGVCVQLHSPSTIGVVSGHNTAIISRIFKRVQLSLSLIEGMDTNHAPNHAPPPHSWMYVYAIRLCIQRVSNVQCKRCIRGDVTIPAYPGTLFDMTTLVQLIQ